MKVPVVLRPGGFRQLLVGQAVSAFGDWLGTIALMALVLELTGSPAAVGGILALRLLPSVFAGPLATTAAVRLDRRRTMLAMDVVRAGLVVLIPFVDALWWVYTLAFLTEVAGLVFLPARDAAIPDLVDDEHLPSANGLVLISSFGNIPLGAAAFAGITSLPDRWVLQRPFAAAFFLDALTYLVSFALIRRIEIRGPAEEYAIEEDESSWAAFTSAFRLPVLRAVLPGLSTVVFGAGALFSLGIVYVQQVLGATTVQFGFLIAIFGLGAGAAVAYVQMREEGTTITVVRVGVAGMGVMLAVMSLLEQLFLAYAVAVAFGAAAATALVGGISFLQENLEGRQRVLGFTAFHIVLRFGMALSAIVAGFASERVGAVHWPVVGRVSPTSLVMFGSGIFVLLGAAAIRPQPVREATGGDT